MTVTDGLQVEQARDRVEAERAKLARVEADLAAATAELESMEKRSGVEVLDDLDSVDKIAEVIGRLRSRILMLGRAAEAQRPRVMVAEAGWFAAHAEALEVVLAEAEERLAEHDSTTARLLAELEAHEGPYVQQKEHVQAIASLGVDFEGLVWREPKSSKLREAAVRARCHVTVIRELTAGRDPELLLRQWGLSSTEAYPACVLGVDALVATPAFVRSVQAQRRRVADLEQAILNLPREIAEREQWAAMNPAEHADEDDHERSLHAITRRQQRLAELPAEVEEARSHLAVMERLPAAASTGMR